MKSSCESLEKRGYIDLNILEEYQKSNTSELYELLNSNNAQDRSAAIHLLSLQIDLNEDNFTTNLLELLSKEKALYTRLEITKILEKANQETCQKMINYLGAIGNNQYKKLPNSVSKKISYPLPRDIIARTLAKTDIDNITTLFKVFDTNDLTKISEVIDAIGFMIFYNPTLDTEYNLNIILKEITNYKQNELILWKLIICLSAFKQEKCKFFLLSLKEEISSSLLLSEIDRSLNLLFIGEIKHD